MIRSVLRLLLAAGMAGAVSVAVIGETTVNDSPFSASFDPALGLPGIRSLYVTSGGRRVELDGAPIERQDGEFLLRVYRTVDGRRAEIRIGSGPEGSVRLEFAVTPKGEFEKLGVEFEIGSAEGFYGLMERVVQGAQGASWAPCMTEALNLRGQIVDLYTLPTVSIYAPFFVSSSGYGVYIESDYPGTYRFGTGADRRTAPTQMTIEQEGPALSLLLLPGPTPLGAVQRYARLTGPSRVPPRFLFEPGRWRDEVWDLPAFYDGTPYAGPYNSMVVEDALMMEALGIPCSWMVVDRPWAAGTFGYGDMLPDPVRFPDLRGMVGWLKERGIATLLWVGPWVMDGQRDVAMTSGYDVGLTLPYLPNAALLDFTNSEAAAWWADELRPLFDLGIAGFKLDRGEEKPPDGQLFRGAYHDETPYREGHNAFPLWFARAAEAAANAAGAEDFVLFYRAGWSGMSRITASWGGDTDPSSWGLRSAIIAVQRAAVLNVPVWGSDTGGYNARPPREVLARWLAFSAFTPIMEVGPTANLAPWSWLPDASADVLGPSGYSFLTVYDRELLAVWSFYAQLHSALAGTTYALAQQAHDTGTPIVRPMVLAYPDRPEYVDTWDQYLYGPDLLVRPVWEEGRTQVDVSVPPGAWIDAWTGTRYIGPATVTVDAPLHMIPILVREGGAIDLGDLPGRWAEALARVARPPSLAAGAAGIP